MLALEEDGSLLHTLGPGKSMKAPWSCMRNQVLVAWIPPLQRKKMVTLRRRLNHGAATIAEEIRLPTL